MSDLLYVRIDLAGPNATTMSHIAELMPINEAECRIQRIIELNADDTVGGAGIGSMMKYMQLPPQEIVPHPDLYQNFTDITATPITMNEFERFWDAAIVAFPELG